MVGPRGKTMDDRKSSAWSVLDNYPGINAAPVIFSQCCNSNLLFN